MNRPVDRIDTELDDRLAGELGPAAYRFPPPPVADLHRRAGRRRRTRLARQAAGTLAVVTLAAFGVTTVLGGDDGSTVTPARPPGESCVSTATDPRPLEGMRLLPDHIPTGTRFRQTSGAQDTGACSDQQVVTGWHVDAGKIDRWVEVGSVGGDTTPGERCDPIKGMFESGECRDAEVAGAARPAWWTRLGVVRMVAWVEGGRFTTVRAYGYDEAAFAEVVADLRIAGGRRTDLASLPGDLESWSMPAERPSSLRTFEARYSPLPTGDPEADGAGDVTFTVTDNPAGDPFAGAGEGGGVIREVVSVDGRPGVWSQDGSVGAWLRWRGPDGLLLAVTGERLTKEEALAVARSVREIEPDDERLTCDPGNPWGGCEGAG